MYRCKSERSITEAHLVSLVNYFSNEKSSIPIDGELESVRLHVKSCDECHLRYFVHSVNLVITEGDR